MGLEDDIRRLRQEQDRQAEQTARFAAAGVSMSDPAILQPPSSTRAWVHEALPMLTFNLKVHVGTGPDGIKRLRVGGMQVKVQHLFSDVTWKTTYNDYCAIFGIGPQGKDTLDAKCYIFPNGTGVFPLEEVDQWKYRGITADIFHQDLVKHLAR